MRYSFTALCALISIITTIGCGSDGTPTSPGSQPRIVNSTDTFEFQVTAMQNYSAVWRYNWTTTGTVANVDQSCVVDGGGVTLRLIDADGTVVYSRDLVQDGSFTSEAGATGQWRIEIVLSKCSGTLNFRVQKNQ
jgi:hypothetical protein